MGMGGRRRREKEADEPLSNTKTKTCIVLHNRQVGDRCARQVVARNQVTVRYGTTASDTDIEFIVQIGTVKHPVPVELN